MTHPTLPCQPLAQRLPRLSADDAHIARLVFDARFERWLHPLIGMRCVTMASRTVARHAMTLEVHTEQGSARLVLDGAEWPALALAAALPDRHAACAVAQVLLQPLAQRLAPALGMVDVVACHPLAESAGAAMAIGTPAGTVLLRGLDERLSTHLGGLLPRHRAPWPSLKLRGRLRVMQRRWPQAVLRSLAPGDTVIAAAGRPVHTLIFGMGATMQANASIDLHRHAVQATSTAQFRPDDGGGDVDAPPADALNDLEVPVSFEIDTARISLGELASMRPGYVVELDVPLLEACVRLVCHGQTVGSGQLVAVGEQLGVRITRMAQHVAER